MQRRRKLALAAASLLLIAILASPCANAYIDPGTTQQVWSTLGPIIGILLACLSAALVAFRFLAQRLWGIFRKRAGAVILVVAGLLAAAAAWLLFAVGHWSSLTSPKYSLAGVEHRTVNYNRVIVIGIDGLDPGVLERMMDAGQLPNCARLRAERTFARLQTTVPPESPVAWVSAATGMNPGRHGLFDFIRRDPKTYLPDLAMLRAASPGALKRPEEMYVPASDCKTFWEVLSEKGIPATVIRWPVTFPPRPLNGKLLSGLGTPDVTGNLGRYSFFTTAPLAPDDKAPERVTVVKWNGNLLRTELAGPDVQGVWGRKTSAVPLRIERGADEKKVRVLLGDAAPFELGVSQWSEYVPLSFPGGLSRACPASVRLYLVSLTPEFNLYVSAPQMDPQRPACPFCYPAAYSADLAREIGPFATLGMPEDNQAVQHGRIPLSAYLELCNQITREREAMFDAELKRFQRGLLAVVFDTSDRVQHMFWAATDPTHPAYSPELARQYGDEIAKHYRRMDKVIGKALSAADKDTALFVLSDHGFTSFKRAVHLNRWLIDNGYMKLTGEAGEGTPLLRNVDWSRTKAYAVGFCSLFLNLAGRERDGIVQPGEESRALTEQLAQALRDWRDPETGATVVRNVYPKEEVYQGEKLADAPDLVIGYAPGYRASWQTALGAAPAGSAIIVNKDSWSGDHLVDAPCVPGVFLSNVRCSVPNPRLIDVAPTVLKALQVEVPPGMDGRPGF